MNIETNALTHLPFLADGTTEWHWYIF